MKKKFLTSIFGAMLILSACGTSEDNADKNNNNGNGGNTSEEAPKENKAQEQAKAPEGGYPQLSTEVAENERLVEMVTSMGTIKIKLFPDLAPKTVDNFIKLSEKNYYDGVIFHRVIKDFMIQGGDPDGTGMGGESAFGAPFEDEFNQSLMNFRGALSMANSGPNTNGSQFFIVQKTKLDDGMADQMKQAGYPDEAIKGYEKGGTPWLDFKHTVFGQVVEGMDVVDKIANVETGEADKPAKDVVIKDIKIVK
ncbi:peptidylprolyl isomerase [Bacillus sp. FJAT-18017]|uniref:peptidylprolyl isomerase n=1 Tax=Bacillus sp. FJAT-18017 TaxID=1705566 RepID=UPI0006AEC726|nr:peptidylprolyl isomerase [Bacillus sp. FJAT-18017]ALC89500.1 peptidylprolyl isomerase [Bacillus sp. FJAT-18017]